MCAARTRTAAQLLVALAAIKVWHNTRMKLCSDAGIGVLGGRRERRVRCLI